MARTPSARTALLVTAHPDDESMFFVPTLQQLVSSGYNVHVLCLSTGNAEGLGAVRSKELVAACRLLQIPAQNVHVVDHPQLQDGMKTAAAQWPAEVIQQQVRKQLAALPATTVVTFDYFGVSAHPNHVALHTGVRLLLQAHGRELGVAAAWQLVSLPRLIMFLGPLLVLLSLLMRSLGCWVVWGGLPSAKVARAAMATHHSQWVWYRRLFVLLSAYGYINFLRPMQIS